MLIYSEGKQFINFNEDVQESYIVESGGASYRLCFDHLGAADGSENNPDNIDLFDAWGVLVSVYSISNESAPEAVKTAFNEMLAEVDDDGQTISGAIYSSYMNYEKIKKSIFQAFRDKAELWECETADDLRQLPEHMQQAVNKLYECIGLGYDIINDSPETVLNDQRHGYLSENNSRGGSVLWYMDDARSACIRLDTLQVITDYEPEE